MLSLLLQTTQHGISTSGLEAFRVQKIAKEGFRESKIGHG